MEPGDSPALGSHSGLQPRHQQLCLNLCVHSVTGIALELQIFTHLPKKTYVLSGLKGSWTTYLAWEKPGMCV